MEGQVCTLNRTAGEALSSMPSHVIRDFSYNVASRELVVTFVTGRIYAYADVPEAVVRAFRASFSKGRFFNQEIRDRYDCRELARPTSSPGSVPPHMAPGRQTGSRR
jgi:hypothetical protein